MLASNKDGQALLRATGFIGVSEPEDRDDVEDGDILDDDVVKPNGKHTVLPEEVVNPGRFALVKTELTDVGEACAALAAL